MPPYGEEAKAQLAYVPDFPYTYDKLTSLEFMHFVGDIFGITTAAIEKVIIPSPLSQIPQAGEGRVLTRQLKGFATARPPRTGLSTGA